VVRRYSYAFINDRVLLVEPLTGIVVAELDRRPSHLGRNSRGVAALSLRLSPYFPAGDSR
jgi:hypothetical protein